MSNLVLTVVGQDRAGLVAALAEAITEHGGNWEHSQLSELAGTFAGVVLVSVPDDRAEALIQALNEMEGLLNVAVAKGDDERAGTETQELRISVLGSDRPGIVQEISSVLAEHSASIESMATESREAPMAGGHLFEANIVARVASDVDPASLRSALERLAAELMVDIGLGEVA